MRLKISHLLDFCFTLLTFIDKLSAEIRGGRFQWDRTKTYHLTPTSEENLLRFTEETFLQVTDTGRDFLSNGLKVVIIQTHTLKHLRNKKPLRSIST